MTTNHPHRSKRRAIDFPGRDMPKVDPFPARGYNVTFNLRTRSLKETRHHLCVDVAPVPPDTDDEADAIKVINLLNAASDLLTALQYAETILASYSTTRVGVHHECLAQVRAAIAKAGG